MGQHLGGETVRRIGEQIGAEEEPTRRAVAGALPVLIGALARHANASRRGADALASALERDHDGSLLDVLDELLHRSAPGAGLGDAASGYEGGYSIDRRTIDGDGIVAHILGDRRGAVELGISRASGMDVGQVNRLLSLLGPVLMNVLGRVVRERKLSTDGVASLLNKERAAIERAVPDRSRIGLLDFLDEEDDGSLTDDVAQIGASLGEAHVQVTLFGRPQHS